MKEEKLLDEDEVVLRLTINTHRTQKFLIRKDIIMEYPFGKKIYEKINDKLQFTMYKLKSENNAKGLDEHYYNNFITINQGMEMFYDLLFNGFALKPFEQIKTKREKELKKNYDLIDYEDKEIKIEAGIVLAKLITKRFFKNNPHLINREEIISNFFSEYINERTKITELKNEVEGHYELFEDIDTERQILKNKLKRNFLKDEGLKLYKEIIVEIAKDEMIGHKPNIQRICNTIAANKNLNTDLRKAFDQWRKRNIATYKILLEKEKVEKKLLFNEI